MNDNLIFYINKLSNVIVSEDFDNDKSQNPKKKTDQFFNKCVRRLRQRGCDVLLNQNSGIEIVDPCLTDYGGNWSPVTLITDYGRELKAQGAGKFNDVLVSCIATLEEKQYDCVEDLLKLLLLLRRPPSKESTANFQNDISLNTSDFLLNGIDSLSFLSEEFSSEGLSKSASYRKALHYEESWTKHFDSKFQLLGEYSKKNLATPERLSLKSIFSGRDVVSSQSRTNSFGFTDFYSGNYKSAKSLFDINSEVYLNENPLLDTFVDRPITHKLPTLKPTTKFSCKSGFLERSSEEIKAPSQAEVKPEADTVSVGEQSRKSSVIQLKRNSNCSHSFSILYEKTVKSQGSWNLDSNENLKKTQSAMSNSKEIILGLWEHEQSLIKEFKPELAPTLPALRMITQAEYIEDVKYLFTGINSDTFKFDVDKNGFTMVYGTCLEDVTPESLYHFSKDFLDVGDSYVKLLSCVHETGKNSFDNCTTISQAFWKSIFDYLELHYSLVLEIPVTTNLMALKSCTRDLHEIITTIANICKVHNKAETLPQGGELISHLLQIVEGISKQCIVNIVYGILQNCCNVYYMCILQNWMFKGRLDDSNNEFFVDHHRQKGKTKSRTYYNSFFLIDQRIPSFLRGYEESFYNCGKSVHFLRLFNADDNFCQMLEKGYYPPMRLCFADEQLDNLEEEFREYQERVLKTCGEKITIKMIMEEEKEKERLYQESIKRFKIIQEKEKEVARLKRLEELKWKKEEQNKLLNEQRNSIDAEKEKKKQEEREKELKEEAQIREANEAKENLLNKEKSLLKNYYGELMKTMQKKIAMTDAKKKNLKRLLEKTNDVSTDLINGNEPEKDEEGNEPEKDEEGNETDENSNSARFSPAEKTSANASDAFRSTDLLCDENSNVSELTVQALEPDKNGNETNGTGEPNEVEKKDASVRKTVSYRTIAAEEAEKNKCKVLRSEFGLQVRTDHHPPEAKPSESLSEFKGNGQRMLHSEYDILLRKADTHISLTSVSHRGDTSRDNLSDVRRRQKNSEELGNPSVTTVQLQRKSEHLNLSSTAEKTEATGNSESNISLSNDFSTENASNLSDELERVGTFSCPVVNEKYQDALTRDAEIFKKNSHQDIFCSLKEEEIDNLPCTDFLKFQRFLRRSALIPLRVQEKLANDALLKHLLLGENLLSHLNSLRGYFFLNDGEFGRCFTHHIFRSLAKCTEPYQFFERSNLSNIVNEAQNYTIHSAEPNAQNLSFRIVKMPPFLNHSSHDVLSPFELSYKVDWPLNFILTEKALSKYKTVFRFLLKLKRINWTLNENFLYLNSYFKCSRQDGKVIVGSTHYHKIQVFRHAMTQVMVTLDDYIFSNGIQFPWIFFLKDLETTENIDHLYQKHVKYIKDVLSRCFLSKNSEDLLLCIHSLIELALKFHYTCKSSRMEFADGKYEHPKFKVLKATFNEFCTVIKRFLKTLKEKLLSNEVTRSHYVLLEKFDLKLT